MIMANNEVKSWLDEPRAIPHLNMPVASSTVDIRIINTTCYQKTSTGHLLRPQIAGHDELSFPSYAFLITNRNHATHVLFDLGMRKDWRKACPLALMPLISDDGSPAPLQVYIERDVFDIIDGEEAKTGISTKDISAVIWSHHHFDHRGDMSRFDPSTKLIVGPGLLETYLHNEFNKSEIEGRIVVELSQNELNLDIAGCPAHDAFGDGSLYILSCPGHTIGHLCALARTTSSPNSTYVLLGGDCAYHCGEFRPSPYIPLPQQIAFKSPAWYFSPNASAAPPVLRSRQMLVCAGEFIKDMVHPQRSATDAFYDTPCEPVVHSHADACDSIAKVELFDAHDDVLVCISHDPSLMSVLPLFPHTFNDWHKKGYKQKLHWEFLNDFI